jgi:hypothetical protein
VLQLYLGPQPLAAGARPFHGFEVYGALVLALDRERFELKGFVGDGTITLEHAGTDAGSVLRGRVDAHLVTLTPEEAANGSRL